MNRFPKNWLNCTKIPKFSKLHILKIFIKIANFPENFTNFKGITIIFPNLSAHKNFPNLPKFPELLKFQKKRYKIASYICIQFEINTRGHGLNRISVLFAKVIFS